MYSASGLFLCKRTIGERTWGWARSLCQLLIPSDARSRDSGKSDVSSCFCGGNPGEGESLSGSHGVGARRHCVPMFTLA